MTLRGWADLYAWQLDRASRTPLTRQIYMQVRAAVLSGALRPGTRVPSSRMLAGKLGVARASVVAAYEHLLAEGYVESRAGSGTFISADLTSLGGGPRSPRGALRPRAGRRHGRHPAGNRHRDPRAAGTGRRGVGRGSGLPAHARAAAARQDAAASSSRRRAGPRGRSRAARGAAGARRV